MQETQTNDLTNAQTQFQDCCSLFHWKLLQINPLWRCIICMNASRNLKVALELFALLIFGQFVCVLALPCDFLWLDPRTF